MSREETSQGTPTRPRKRFRWARRLGWVVLVLVVIFGIARAVLPVIVRDYVNRSLARGPIYTGRMRDVEIHLWRGAYSIDDIKVSKATGEVPVPLFAAKRVDFAVQWSALFHGRIVAQIVMEEPQLNFVDAASSDESQSGKGGGWLEMTSSLSPFTINSAVVHNGSVHFRSFSTKQPVDVYISSLEASVDDLTNVRGEAKPLVTTVTAKGKVMDQASLQFKMALDPFAYHPTFHEALRVIGLDVTRLNALALAYGKFDFKRGWLDLIIESDCKDGEITGYVKPLFRDLKVFSLTQDIKEDNVFQVFWQALVGATTAIFKNHARNQFGTLIPFTGDVSGAKTIDILATLGNMLRNAFVRAYLPRLEPTEAGTTPTGSESLQFGPASFNDALSVDGDNL